MSRTRKAVRALALVGLIGTLPVVSVQEASALTPTTGSIVAYGMLSAPGLTTSPTGTTPDVTQWDTWPSRSWQLYSDDWSDHFCVSYRPDSTKDFFGRSPGICSLYVAGSMYGWCDLSKGIGSPVYYGYDGYYSSWYYDGADFSSFRWTGAGSTLVVSADMRSWGSTGEVGGSLVGTVTLLETGTSFIDLCTDPDGIQSPIPVLINFEYVLQ